MYRTFIHELDGTPSCRCCRIATLYNRAWLTSHVVICSRRKKRTAFGLLDHLLYILDFSIQHFNCFRWRELHDRVCPQEMPTRDLSVIRAWAYSVSASSYSNSTCSDGCSWTTSIASMPLWSSSRRACALSLLVCKFPSIMRYFAANSAILRRVDSSVSPGMMRRENLAKGLAESLPVCLRTSKWEEMEWTRGRTKTSIRLD